MKKFILFIFILGFFVEAGYSQTFFNNKYNRRFLLIGGAGTSSYFGDLNNPKDIFDPTLNFSVGLIYELGPQFSIRSEFQYYRLKGSDVDKQFTNSIERNLSFKANNQEVNFVGIYQILKNGTRYYQRPPINPYVFGGVGMTFFKPKAEYNGQTYSLRKLKTEGRYYSPVTLVVPVGAGVKFKAGPSFTINIEASYHKTFTDYLDDVSTVYVDPANFTNPIALALQDRSVELGYEPRAIGNIRGNPGKKDAYAFFSVKLEYYIPSDVLNTKNFKKRPPGTRPTKRKPFRLGGRKRR
ncbi:MAG: porin family protein [Cyclobacteriaceae bacterium]|nr:porin family protein [Cyclobacteriaceae bacterium]